MITPPPGSQSVQQGPAKPFVWPTSIPDAVSASSAAQQSPAPAPSRLPPTPAPVARPQQPPEPTPQPEQYRPEPPRQFDAPRQPDQPSDQRAPHAWNNQRQTQTNFTESPRAPYIPPSQHQQRPAARKRFEDLTSIDPQPRLTLEYPGCPDSCRLIDLFCPIGRGQRALIVSPPKAGKTTLLKDISLAIATNNPEVEIIALLVDERPEEVTDFKRHFAKLGPKSKVIASSNDHGVEKHIQISTQTIAECKQAVEEGRHIVIVLDSLTRLGRAFNLSRRHASSGRTLSGGLDAKALEVPRQIFGAARNTEEAGSLTIIATCLIDTGSRGDEVIFEEFKGSGNMELVLDRKIAERRLYPAINLSESGTRKENLLLSLTEMKTMTALRRQLLAMPPHLQVERLVQAMQRFPTNAIMVGAVQG